MRSSINVIPGIASSRSAMSGSLRAHAALGDKPLADALALAVSVVFAAVALGLALWLLSRWRHATPARRQALTAVLFAGLALAMLLFAATTIVPIAGVDATFAGVLGIAALVPFALVGYLFLGSLARTHILRGGAFRELVGGLSGAPSPGELRAALAKTLGDPSGELAFWLPESGRYAFGTSAARATRRAAPLGRRPRRPASSRASGSSGRNNSRR